MKIAHLVKSIRLKAKLTQKQFAEKLGITRQRITNYETGRTIPPGDTLLKIQDFGKRQPEPISNTRLTIITSIKKFLKKYKA